VRRREIRMFMGKPRRPPSRLGPRERRDSHSRRDGRAREFRLFSPERALVPRDRVEYSCRLEPAGAARVEWRVCEVRIDATGRSGYDADWIRALASQKGAFAIFHRDAIAVSRCASARISIVPEIWLSGSSTDRRRVATRYDKLAANYLAFVQLASIRLRLRVNESAS
jgi:transposase